MKFSALLCSVALSISPLLSLFVSANDFAGANSYFLFNMNADDRAAVLDAMQGAEMKLLRVFISQVQQGNKGSSASGVNDLETVAVGSYDDTILNQIDELAKEANSRGIKLVIAMHDRYALGCWTTDAYVKKYNLPNTGCNGVPDSSTFYTDSGAIADYDNRLRHILNYQSPNFGVPWSQLSDAIFAFEVQNEGQGHMDQVAPNWWCDRSGTIRSVLGGSGIQISTGGGTDLPTSTQSQFYDCDDLQIIAIHEYDLDTSYISSHLDPAKSSALSSGKRILYEEWGAEGSGKQGDVQSVTDFLIKTGVPWMYWELTKPGSGSSNYEVWTDEGTWGTLQSQSKSTYQQNGEFAWPEIS